ncbi:MFS transporter [Megamonas hypermegale]|uniref:MFS transporter n=1 Tax=Megamonas hypermegale TaxID=158847 RepID=UPI00195EF400|nr:MFS transporter [Megamonas hypermegale]MBM6760502.1 MFS transporter [Megamonas hypermegale]
MTKVKLWTRNFMALVWANGLLFAGFHFLLPTLPLYAASIGATGTEIGIITGIFGFSAIFIRLFTDTGVRKFGKKKCLYFGLFCSFLATFSYDIFTSVYSLILARILHGIGFGLSTTFAAALVADVIPAQRRGEGIGYFGLGSTVAMAVAPALGVMLLTDFSANILFLTSMVVTLLSAVSAKLCNAKEAPLPAEKKSISIRHKICEYGTGIPSILTVLFGAAYGSINTFVAMMANEAGIENAGLFFIVGTIFVFISRPFGGRIFDSKGGFWVILPGGILYLIGLCILISSSSLTMLLVASVFYGLGGGLLLPSLMTWMLNVVTLDRRSGASATFYNMLDIGTSSGIILLGSVAGSIGYVNMYFYVIAVMVIFIVFFLFNHFVLQKKQSKRKHTLA